MSKRITVSNLDKTVTYELAGFWERFAARLIDVIIIFIPNAIIPLIPSWLYWALQQSGNAQATVGQKALNIKVIDVNGGKISFGQATGRFFGNILNMLTFFIGYFMYFFTEKNQCLHDLISGCLVVKEIPVESVDDISSMLIDDDYKF